MRKYNKHNTILENSECNLTAVKVLLTPSLPTEAFSIHKLLQVR